MDDAVDDALDDAGAEGEVAARAELVRAARRLEDLGLNHNSSGNLSVRAGAGLLVTPSGIPADRLGAEDMVLLDGDGHPARSGQRTPTSEWRLHASLVARRPDAAAVVHTHSVEATAAATLGAPLPAIHYVVARFGTTELRCAPYATYGSAELATAVNDTLAHDATACLMANHGAVALAADLEAAVALAFDVEWFCSVVRRARAQGRPVVLSDDELARVAERFGTYGQPSG